MAPEPTAGDVVEALSVDDTESYPPQQRPFIDRVWLKCKGGNGGNPAPYALRQIALGSDRPVPKGPGYGGHGGSVFLKCTHLIESLLNVPRIVKAKDGGDGKKSTRGLHADDYCLQVPVGTIVREHVYTGQKTDTFKRILVPQFRYQFLRSEDTFLVAKGGIGGIGPQSFKKHDGRPGTPGQTSRIELELRIVNDVALVGMPNAGKTALLASLSRAHTRIGPEVYSTTRPHVGVIRYRDRVEVRVCDLPGVEAGAHEDKKMGRRILRHTYRSRALAFVVDMARGEKPETDTLDEVEMLRQEATRFDPLNIDKPWMVIGSKCDALHKDAMFHLDSLHFRIRARYGIDIPVVGTSARFGLGLTRLVRTLRQLVYPDMLESSLRVQAHPLTNLRLPMVLNSPYDGPLPSAGELVPVSGIPSVNVATPAPPLPALPLR